MIAQNFSSKTGICAELAGNSEHFSGNHNFDHSPLKEIGLAQIFSLFSKTKHHHLFNVIAELKVT